LDSGKTAYLRKVMFTLEVVKVSSEEVNLKD